MLSMCVIGDTGFIGDNIIMICFPVSSDPDPGKKLLEKEKETLYILRLQFPHLTNGLITALSC